MVFKKMLRAFGVGGPTVDTVLDDSTCRPGGTITGQVRITGGDHQVGIDYIALSLLTKIERDGHGGTGGAAVEFQRTVVTGRSTLDAGEERVIPFDIALPWETPINRVGGAHLPGMELGLRTELAVAKAVDKGDLDPVYVEPLDSQERVLDAFGELGFRFRAADLEAGLIHGVRQEVPFFQEIEFVPPPGYANLVTEVEVTFVANPTGLVVVLEADRRGGVFQRGGDSFGRFHVSHEEALTMDWTGRIDDWLGQLAGHRTTHHQHGHHGHHDQHGQHGGHRGGMGAGAVVGGVAAGLVGGMVLGEVFDEAGDMFFGDED